MIALELELDQAQKELKQIKELISKLFNAKSIKEFLETQHELKRYRR